MYNLSSFLKIVKITFISSSSFLACLSSSFSSFFIDKHNSNSNNNNIYAFRSFYTKILGIHIHSQLKHHHFFRIKAEKKGKVERGGRERQDRGWRWVLRQLSGEGNWMTVVVMSEWSRGAVAVSYHSRSPTRQKYMCIFIWNFDYVHFKQSSLSWAPILEKSPSYLLLPSFHFISYLRSFHFMGMASAAGIPLHIPSTFPIFKKM